MTDKADKLDSKDDQENRAAQMAGGAAAGDSAAPAGPDGADAAASALDPAMASGAAEVESLRAKRARAKRVRIGIVAAVVAVAAIYFGGCAWFSGHFDPNTNIGGYDVSGLSADEAASMMEADSGSYALSVTGGGLDFEVTSEGTGLRLDSAKVAEQAMAENDAWAWPASLVSANAQDLTDAMQVTFDEDGLKDLVVKQVKAANKEAEAPVSATIAYDEDAQSFAVVPEQAGTKLDSDAVLAKVEEAAYAMETEVQIGDDELQQPDILSDDERLSDAVEAANKLVAADIQLTLGGLDWLEVDAAQIAGWVVLDDDVKPSLDEQAVRDWAQEQVDDVNSIGIKRSFKTPGGTKVKVSGGTYGWQIDTDPFITALVDAVNAGTVGELEVPCVQTAASITDEDGVDFGTKYIEVNLKTQHATFYDGKKVIWESDIISGAPDGEHDTPTGVYYVNNKESPSTLVGEMVPVETTTGKGKKAKTVTTYEPEYETEVQYWMAFVGSGVGFHDATWQPDFGGTMYQDGYGSHGCVNLPLDAAKELYGLVEVGTPVIVHK